MIKITLKRYKINNYGKFSKVCLYDDDKLIYQCNALEQLKSGLEANKNYSLPTGTYKCDFHISPSKSNGCEENNNIMLRLSNDAVAKSRQILIHIGNYLKNTKGCILLGIVDINYTGVYSSKQTCKEFYTNIFNLCKKYNLDLKENEYICKLELSSELSDDLYCV